MTAPYKILVVDDEPRNVDILRTKLEAEGFEIATADDGESALFAFQQTAPAMVLLDIMMPGLDGKAVCAAMKARCGKTFIPIILVSALTSSEAKAEGFAAGADDYLAKPVDFAELIARIRNMRRLQSMAHQDQIPAPPPSTWRKGEHTHDDIIKILADDVGDGRHALFRLQADTQTGFIATRGRRLVHARAGALAGRAAVEAMLQWNGASWESIAYEGPPTNFDVPFDDFLGQWLERMDAWRLLSEKLPPRTTWLAVNNARVLANENLDAAQSGLLAVFGAGCSVDEALRRVPIDLLQSVRAVGELYYKGLLLRAPEGAAMPADAATETPGGQARLEALSLGLSAANDNLREENAELRLRLQGQTEAAAQDRERVVRALEEENASLRSSVALFEMRVAKVAMTEADLAGVREQLADEEQARTSAENALAQMRAEAVQYNAQVEGEMNRLRAEVEAARAKVTAEAAGVDFLKLQVELEERRAQNSDLEALHHAAKEESRVLRERLALAEKAAANPRSSHFVEHMQEQADMILQLRNTLREKEEEIANAKKAREKTEIGIVEKDAIISSLRSQMAEASARNLDLLQRADSEGGETLQALTREVESLRASNAMRDADLRQLQEQLDAVGGGSPGFQGDEKDREIMRLREQIAKADERREVLLENSPEGERNVVQQVALLAGSRELTERVQAMFVAVREKDQEIINLRGQIIAAATQTEESQFLIKELNWMLEAQKKDYEKRLAAGEDTLVDRGEKVHEPEKKSFLDRFTGK